MTIPEVEKSVPNKVEVEVWTVRQLVAAFTAGEDESDGERQIVIPSFQRGFVWKRKKRAELIDSIKKALPIGSLLMYRGGVIGNKQKYQLVDGLQRSTSLRNYEREVFELFSDDSIDDADATFIDDVLAASGISKNLDEGPDLELARKKLRRTVRIWVKSLKSFSTDGGFKMLALRSKIAAEFGDDVRSNDKVGDRCETFLERLKYSLSIGDYQLPVVVMSGTISDLPKVFKRLNTAGTKLNKYDILGSSWSDQIVEVQRDDLKAALAERRKLLDDPELIRLSFDRGSGKFELFHAVCALGDILVKKFPLLYKSVGKEGSPQPCGFNLLTSAFEHRVDDFETLPEEIKKMGGFDAVAKGVFAASDHVQKLLAPLAAVNVGESSIRYLHTELQLASIVAVVFRSFGELAPHHTLPSPQRDARIVQHYLVDILRGWWAGTGDTKAYQAIKSDRYAEEVPRTMFAAYANSVNQASSEAGAAVDTDVPLQALLRAYAVAYTDKTDAARLTLAAVPAIPSLGLIGNARALANLNLVEGEFVLADPGKALGPLPKEPSRQQIDFALQQRLNVMIDLVATHFKFGS